jgi:DNA-binding XRE family transcriptional regulator
MMDNKHIGGSWTEHKAEMLEKELVTEEELSASRLRASIMGELIKARNEQKISQRKLEELTGIRKSTITRMENGQSSPTIDTVLRALAPLGKTLAVVSNSDDR